MPVKSLWAVGLLYMVVESAKEKGGGGRMIYGPTHKVGLTRFHPTSCECDTVLHDPSPIYFDVCRVAEPCWCGLMS